MKYMMTIERMNNSSKKDFDSINDIPTWDKVRQILRNGLDQWTIKVHVYKWSSNDRCLGHICVTMGNLWNVLSYGTDKILK